MLNRVSIDGFFAGPNGEIDWFVRDPEVDKAVHAREIYSETNEERQPRMVLFGRVTYQMFERYWPNVSADPSASEELRATANELDQMTKVVFSSTLKEVAWENSVLVSGDLAKEVRKLKQEEGPDMLIFGSGSIVQQLANEDLIDDYLIVVTPVVLGEGKPLFKDVNKHNLQLLQATGFESGNVLLHYAKA
ncbi:MAG TPA: dihydrofolate reductase family protein [Candidatus Lokiarchaeia archaeon]|nr:dihydrofolate reductase family protein [Candidatus Lokiarchaeia archaeon]